MPGLRHAQPGPAVTAGQANERPEFAACAGGRGQQALPGGWVLDNYWWDAFAVLVAWRPSVSASGEFGSDNILCFPPTRLSLRFSANCFFIPFMSLYLQKQRFSLDKHRFVYILLKLLFASYSLSVAYFFCFLPSISLSLAGFFCSVFTMFGDRTFLRTNL